MGMKKFFIPVETAMIAYRFCGLRQDILPFLTPQTLWQGLVRYLRLFREKRIGVEFPGLAKKLVSHCNDDLLGNAWLSESCHPHYRIEFLKIRTADYRIHVKHAIRRVFQRWIFHMPCDAPAFVSPFCRLFVLLHIHIDCSQFAKPNNRFWILSFSLSPRIVQCLSVYTLFAYQLLFDVPNPGRLARVAGNLISCNYKPKKDFTLWKCIA